MAAFRRCLGAEFAADCFRCGLSRWRPLPPHRRHLADQPAQVIVAGVVGIVLAVVQDGDVVRFPHAGVRVALGPALFTLVVGVGTGISYGAYAPQSVPIGRSIMAVAVFDTVIALLAGLAIFPIVFANHMEPTAGPGLLFISLPYAFGNLMQGELVGAVFFVMMVLAALGSAVALMEPVVAMLMQQARLSRFTAALIVGAIVWLLGWVIVVSLQSGQVLPWFGKQNLLAVLDALTARVLLPLVALLIAVLAGWRLRPEILRLELVRESALFFSLWRFLLRYIAPLAIALLLFPSLLLVGVRSSSRRRHLATGDKLHHDNYYS